MTAPVATFGIITLSFNQRRFLEDALKSVLDQLVDLRYVVVDPGSTDGSREFLTACAAFDERVTLVLEPDRGPSDGLNAGLKALPATRYLGYLNADDSYLPQALTAVEAALGSRPNVDVLLASVIRKEHGKTRLLHSDPFSLARYANGFATVLQQGTFIRRRPGLNIFFNPDNRTCWDAELLVDLALQKATFDRVRVPVAVFNVHSDSITGSQRLRHQYRKDAARLATKCLGAPQSRLLRWALMPMRKVRRGVLRGVELFRS